MFLISVFTENSILSLLSFHQLYLRILRTSSVSITVSFHGSQFLLWLSYRRARFRHCQELVWSKRVQCQANHFAKLTETKDENIQVKVLINKKFLRRMTNENTPLHHRSGDCRVNRYHWKVLSAGWIDSRALWGDGHCWFLCSRPIEHTLEYPSIDGTLWNSKVLSEKYSSHFFKLQCSRRVQSI